MGHKELISRIAHRPTGKVFQIQYPVAGPYVIANSTTEPMPGMHGMAEQYKSEIIVGATYCIDRCYHDEPELAAHIHRRTTAEISRYIYGDVVEELQNLIPMLCDHPHYHHINHITKMEHKIRNLINELTPQ